MIGLRKKGDNLSQLKNKRWKLFLIAFGIILIILVGVFIFINYNFGTKVAASLHAVMEVFIILVL